MRQRYSRTGRYLRWGSLGCLLLPAFWWNSLRLGYPLALWGCPLKALTGIPCPTWGLTRSLSAIAQGNWATALSYHLLSPLLLLLWLGLLLHLAVELITRRQAPWTAWSHWRTSGLIGFSLFIGHHAWRLHGLWSAGRLQADFAQSPLGHLLTGV
ncbi:MAG: DUF2752 domain-containing protein [Leptolyngbya sp. SIO4C1]|nr:DUF2752 domain-containing protein [Leptolyngbya sp. SIO4C1]